MKTISHFIDGKIYSDSKSRKGTQVTFIPDEELFGKYRFINEYVEKMMWNYCYLNTGLTIIFNG